MITNTDATIDVTDEDGVLTLTIRNLSKRNALNNELAGQIIEICDAVDNRDDVAALVIQGAEGKFCSGAETAHLDRRSHLGATAANFEGGSRIYDAFQRVGNVLVPTIAAVRGAAVGAGLNLALAADLRIVADNARLIAGFGRAGLHPGGGFFTLMSRVAGREVAAAMTVFDEEISGVRAAQLGIAFESVPDDRVEARALELARRCTGDPALNRRVIQTLRKEAGPPGMDWPAAIELERMWQLWSLTRKAEKSPPP